MTLLPGRYLSAAAVVAAACLLFTSTSAATVGPRLVSLSAPPANSSDWRLPPDYTPLEYQISLVPDPAGGRFTASVSLVFTPAREHCLCLLLNSFDLNYDYSTMRLYDSARDDHIVLDRLVLDRRLQRLAIFPSTPLKMGVLYQLSVSYNGTISDDGAGLYRTLYKDENGVDRWMAVTQLRPVYARRLFPCFDEPRFKANFQLRVWHDPNDFVLSNTKPISTEKDGALSVTTFGKTPLISTFLVALMISRFPGISTGDFSSYAVPGKVEGVAYSAEIGPKMAVAMERLLSIPYPLPKTDQVALPMLVPVAMENWALYNFKEGNILYFPGIDKTVQKQTAARFSGHEITHAWMGNAVTLGWWDYLWLSEAFAMYYEYFLPGVVEPEWNMMEQMVIDLTQLGLSMDSQITTTPLTTRVLTPDEIVAKFGGITYFKGPSLIRMVSHVLTENRYVKGFSKFLVKNWWGNVEPHQLWDTLEMSSDTRLPAPLVNIMSTWTESPGYPVVTATRDYETDYVYLEQDRFFVDGEEQPSNTTWWIPISFTTKEESNFNYLEPQFWFKPRSHQKEKISINPDDWMIFNLQGSGFFRVNYDERNWRNIISQLYSHPSGIHILNRAALIDDSLALARAGLLSHAVALDLNKYLANEDQYIPWASALKTSSLEYYNNILMGSYLHQHFQSYMLAIIDEIYNTVGFREKNTDGHLDKLTRELIVKWACRMGNNDCVDRSLTYVRSLMKGVNPPISVDVIDTALCTAVSAGGQNEWLYVLSEYNTAPADKKSRYLNALACTRDPGIVKMFLENSINELNANTWGARFTAFASLSENADMLLDLLVRNRVHLDNRFGTVNFASYVDAISQFLQTPEHLKKLSTLEKTGLSLTSAVTNVSKRTRWLGKYGSQLRDYFLQSGAIIH